MPRQLREPTFVPVPCNDHPSSWACSKCYRWRKADIEAVTWTGYRPDPCVLVKLEQTDDAVVGMPVGSVVHL